MKKLLLILSLFFITNNALAQEKRIEQKRINECVRIASVVSGAELLMGEYDRDTDIVRYKHCLRNGTKTLEMYLDQLLALHKKGINSVMKCSYQWGVLVGSKKRINTPLFRGEFLKSCIEAGLKVKEI